MELRGALVGGLGWLALVAGPGWGQQAIVPDGTLGVEASQVLPDAFPSVDWAYIPQVAFRSHS